MVVLVLPMCYFLMLPYSIPPWGHVPLFKFWGSFAFYVRNFVGSSLLYQWHNCYEGQLFDIAAFTGEIYLGFPPSMYLCLFPFTMRVCNIFVKGLTVSHYITLSYQFCQMIASLVFCWIYDCINVPLFQHMLQQLFSKAEVYAYITELTHIISPHFRTYCNIIILLGESLVVLLTYLT